MKGRSQPRGRRPARIDGVSIAEFMLRGAHAQPRRDGHRIVISDGLWSGYDVSIEPPLMAYPLRHFRTAAEAQPYIDALVAGEGWPVDDRTAGNSGGGRAA